MKTKLFQRIFSRKTNALIGVFAVIVIFQSLFYPFMVQAQNACDFGGKASWVGKDTGGVGKEPYINKSKFNPQDNFNLVTAIAIPTVELENCSSLGNVVANISARYFENSVSYKDGKSVLNPVLIKNSSGASSTLSLGLVTNLAAFFDAEQLKQIQTLSQRSAKDDPRGDGGVIVQFTITTYLEKNSVQRYPKNGLYYMKVFGENETNVIIDSSVSSGGVTKIDAIDLKNQTSTSQSNITIKPTDMGAIVGDFNTVYRIVKGKDSSLNLKFTFAWDKNKPYPIPEKSNVVVTTSTFNDSFLYKRTYFVFHEWNTLTNKPSALDCTSTIFNPSGTRSGICQGALYSFGNYQATTESVSQTGSVKILDKKDTSNGGIWLDTFSTDGLKAGSGTPIGKKDYFFAPVLNLAAINIEGNIFAPGVSNNHDQVLLDKAKKITVELYATEEARAAAFANENKPCAVKKSDGTQDYSACGQEAGEKQSQNTSGPSSGAGPMNSVEAFLVKVFGWIFGFINYVIFKVFAWIVLPLLKAFLSVRTYKDEFVNIILPGWQVLRDIMNIGFILALIFTGLVTIFRIGGYSYKEMLIDIIIAALLVNFGLVVGQGILAIADTIQNQFLPANSTSLEALAKNLMVLPVQNLNDNLAQLTSGGNGAGVLDSLTYLAISTAVALGTFAIFVALVAFLAIRIVGLLVLLMLSPAAFGLRALPQTKSYSGKWWGEFLHYAFFTPIMAFFINVTALISSSGFSSYANLDQTKFGSGSGTSGDLASFIVALGGQLLMLIFLVAGMKVANQMGVAGAGAVTGFADKLWKTPFTKPAHLLKEGAEYAAHSAKTYALEHKTEAVNKFLRNQRDKYRDKPKSKMLKVSEAIGALGNFSATKAAYQQRHHERDEEAKSMAKSLARTAVKKYWYHESVAPNQQVDVMSETYKKDFLSGGDEQNVASMDLVMKEGGHGKGDPRKLAKMSAVLKNAYSDGSLNEFKAVAKDRGWLHGDYGKFTDDDEGTKKFLWALQQEHGFTESDMVVLQERLDKLAQSRNAPLEMAENVTDVDGQLRTVQFEKKNGKVVVAGKEEYDHHIGEVNKKYDEAVMKKIKDSGGAMTKEQAEKEVSYKKIKKDYDKELKNDNLEEYQKYNNWERNETSKAIKMSNWKKQSLNQQLGAHWQYVINRKQDEVTGKERNMLGDYFKDMVVNGGSTLYERVTEFKSKSREALNEVLNTSSPAEVIGDLAKTLIEQREAELKKEGFLADDIKKLEATTRTEAQSIATLHYTLMKENLATGTQFRSGDWKAAGMNDKVKFTDAKKLLAGQGHVKDIGFDKNDPSAALARARDLIMDKKKSLPESPESIAYLGDEVAMAAKEKAKGEEKEKE